MADQTETAWECQAGPQSLLLTCPAREIFFGGARGGGKTDGALGEFAAHAGEYGEHANGLMVRRSRTELVDTIERSKQIYGKLGATFNESKSFWRFHNGAILRFGYLERDSDADQFQGWSLTRLYVEEVGNFPNERVINKLMATLRSGHGVPCKVIATGNPGGAGQNWVKARWINPHPAGNKLFKRTFKNPFTGDVVEWEWCFIPSKVTDNKYLGGEYTAGLQQVGSEQLVRAWLQGDWDAVEGAYFGEWEEHRHVVPASLVDVAELDGLFFRAVDLGFATPFSVGWWVCLTDDYDLGSRTERTSRGPGLQPKYGKRGDGLRDGRGYRGVLPKGCLLRVGEWYGASSPNVGIRLPAETLARGILNRDPVEFERIAYTVVDPKGFSAESGPSVCERMGNMGLYCRPADNKRTGNGIGHYGGWDVMRGRLRGDVQGRPMIACLDTCLNSIRTIPTLQHDPDKAEDLDTHSEDHAADEWRYACMSRPWRPDDREEDVDNDSFDDYVQRDKPSDDGDWTVY